MANHILFKISGPYHTDYLTINQRENSFPSSIFYSKLYSINGFFFNGHQITCFYCGLNLPITSSGMSLEILHSNLSPSCTFQLLNSYHSILNEYTFNDRGMINLKIKFMKY